MLLWYFSQSKMHILDFDFKTMGCWWFLGEQGALSLSFRPQQKSGLWIITGPHQNQHIIYQWEVGDNDIWAYEKGTMSTIVQWCTNTKTKTQEIQRRMFYLPDRNITIWSYSSMFFDGFGVRQTLASSNGLQWLSIIRPMIPLVKVQHISYS